MQLRLLVLETNQTVSVDERWVRKFDEQEHGSRADDFDKEPLRVAWMQQEFNGTAHYNSVVLGLRAPQGGKLSLPWATDRRPMLALAPVVTRSGRGQGLAVKTPPQGAPSSKASSGAGVKRERAGASRV
jgi:hypothetical protein